MMKSSVFRDSTLRSPLKVNWCFGGACCLMLFLTWCILLLWRWRQHVSPKPWSTFRRLHGVVSQKVELFITTAVRTSKPTNLKLLYMKVNDTHNGISQMKNTSLQHQIHQYGRYFFDSVICTFIKRFSVSVKVFHILIFYYFSGYP
jgi:hypothetical protein